MIVQIMLVNGVKVSYTYVQNKEDVEFFLPETFEPF